MKFLLNPNVNLKKNYVEAVSMLDPATYMCDAMHVYRA
jgi:hypothetical protein